MQSHLVICFALLVVASSGRAIAFDKPDQSAELARLAGEYAAEFSFRTGQVPADPEVLKSLTLKITKDEWTQSFRGEVAAYKITLDLTADAKQMQLTHKTVKAVRSCTYILKADSLAVTEQLGEPGESVVTIWKRKRLPN